MRLLQQQRLRLLERAHLLARRDERPVERVRLVELGGHPRLHRSHLPRQRLELLCGRVQLVLLLAQSASVRLALATERREPAHAPLMLLGDRRALLLGRRDAQLELLCFAMACDHVHRHSLEGPLCLPELAHTLLELSRLKL